jgi:E3 ubiquitin-protein ligase synoviolin
MFVFYVDLITDFLKLSTYLGFFAVIVTFYGVPLNVVRDVYVTARSFITRLRDLMRYRTATRNMDERYPNATQEEMTAMSDHTCIICREEMMVQDTSTRNQANPPGTTVPARDGPNMTPKKLPCGHIFHFYCLRSWLERQQSCPTCRRPVLDTTTPTTGRVEQADALRGGAVAVPQGAAAPFGPAADVPQPPAGHLNNLFRNMVRGPPPPPGAPYPPVQPQQFAAGGPPPHYQWGHQPIGPHYMPPPPPPQLQPAPVFQGFYGPAGVWQPWGDRRLADGAALQERPAQQQQDASHSTARAPTAPAPAPATSEGREQSIPQRAPPEGERPDAQDQGTPSTPRDAAALAALRRMSPGTSIAQNQESSTDTSQPHQITSTTPGPSLPPTTSQATESTPTSSSPSLPPSTAPQPTSTTTTPSRNVNVPLLIPMTFSPGSVGPRPTNAPLSSPSIVYRTVPPRHAPPARPLTTLPPTLTDAQLAHLDVLTRDAIDERLRVLEGVSNTMYRCVEELTRLRSVLPVAAGSAPPVVHTGSEAEQGSTTQTAVNGSENARDHRPLDPDLKLDVPSSDAKSDTDVSGASSSSERSVVANGDTADAPTATN